MNHRRNFKKWLFTTNRIRQVKTIARITLLNATAKAKSKQDKLQTKCFVKRKPRILNVRLPWETNLKPQCSSQIYFLTMKIFKKSLQKKRTVLQKWTSCIFKTVGSVKTKLDCRSWTKKKYIADFFPQKKTSRHISVRSTCWSSGRGWPELKPGSWATDWYCIRRSSLLDEIVFEVSPTSKWVKRKRKQ